MKRLTISCICLFLSLILRAQHVVLISIDGFRPEMYQDPCWPVPNLHWLMAHGTYARHLKSVFPSYTYPSHTAMMTGAFPARTKILHNQSRNNRHGEWNWFMDSVKVPMIWSACKRNGLTTAAVEWPVSVGKDIDYDVPEIWGNNHADRIAESRKYAVPAGLVDEMERAVGKLDSTTMREDSWSLDENSARMAAYIFARYKPNLLAVHLADVDGMEHAYGRDNDSVRMALAACDVEVGLLMEAIKNAGLQDSTTVIVLGDHGFSDIHEVFRPNMLLKDVPAYFYASGGSAFLYPKPGTTLTAGALIHMVKERLARLPQEKQAQFTYVDRPTLDKMGADSAALLALSATPGLVFSSAVTGATTINAGPGTSIQQNPLEGVFIPVKGGHHGYDPNNPQMYSGFIAYGRGVRKGNVVGELCEVDVAPLIGQLLGISFVCPDGRIIPGILLE